MEGPREADAERVLIARVGALGDTLMATPVIRRLRQTEPAILIDFLASASAAPLLSRHPDLHQLYSLAGRNVPYPVSLEKRRLVRLFRRNRYRYAVLLESAPRYRTLLERAGISEIRSFRETPFDPSRHSIENNLRAAGLSTSNEPAVDMGLFLDEAERRRADELLSPVGHPLVGLHAGYGPAGKKKDQPNRLKGWSLRNFARLARFLLREGASIVLTGSRADREVNRTILEQLPEFQNQLLDLAGSTGVREMAAVISRLKLFISVDSGPAHMAAALKRPLVVLWGPAKLQQVRPISHHSPVVIVRHPVPCAPCYDTPAMKSCRLNICMQRITPGEVWEEARRLIELPGR